MSQSEYGPAMLALTGVFSFSLTILWLGRFRPLSPGQSELVSALLLIISVGFVGTGWAWYRAPSAEKSHYRVIPIVTLGHVGVTIVIGSLLVFTPWEYRGFTRAATGLLTGLLVGLGGSISLASYNWLQTGEFRYPLAVCSGILSVGLFHRFAQQFDPTMPVPLVALIVAVLAIAPVIGVLYGLEPQRRE